MYLYFEKENLEEGIEKGSFWLCSKRSPGINFWTLKGSEVYGGWENEEIFEMTCGWCLRSRSILKFDLEVEVFKIGISSRISIEYQFVQLPRKLHPQFDSTPSWNFTSSCKTLTKFVCSSRISTPPLRLLNPFRSFRSATSESPKPNHSQTQKRQRTPRNHVSVNLLHKIRQPIER